MTVFKSTDLTQAIEWLVHLQRHQAPTQDKVQEWEQWIADPEREASFDTIVHLWARTGNLGPLALPDPEEIAADDYDGSIPITEWKTNRAKSSGGEAETECGGSDEVGLTEQVFAVRTPDPRRRWQWQRLAVATAASVALLAWIVYPYVESTLPVKSSFYETGLAQHQSVPLEDGSTLLLGARTALWVTFTRQSRMVVLERGEALFDVARDRQRPFVVHAGNGTITAVGTSFSVQRDREHVEVTVEAGVVRVEPRFAVADKVGGVGEDQPIVATLTRGQQVSYDEGGDGTVSIARVDAKFATAWREGRLQYIDEPLRNVVADVNRYARRAVVLNGPQAENLRFTGVIFQDNAGQWGDQLPDIFPALEIIEANVDQIVLRAHAQDGDEAETR